MNEEDARLRQSQLPEESVRVEYRAFIGEFVNESDRAAVILGTAKLDGLLHSLLQLVLRPVPGADDPLLDGDSPLATVSARINLACRLGLIDVGLTRALHLVRRIRNEFAHQPTAADLSSGGRRDRVRKLVAPLRTWSGFDGFRTLNMFRGFSTPAGEFRVGLAILGARLETAISKAIPVASDREVRLIPGDGVNPGSP